MFDAYPSQYLVTVRIAPFNLEFESFIVASDELEATEMPKPGCIYRVADAVK